jgi:hypothetical protein
MKNARSSQGAAATMISRRAQITCGAPRGQPPRRHRGDPRDLRVVRHPRQATELEPIAAGTKNAQSSRPPRQHHGDTARRASPPPSDREHIAAGTKNVRSSQGAAVTTTSRRSAHRASPARSSQGAAVMTTPRRPARRASPAPTERKHIAAGTKNLTCGAPREQPPRRHCGDLHNLCVVSPVPSEQTRAHRAQRARPREQSPVSYHLSLLCSSLPTCKNARSIRAVLPFLAV